MPKDRLNNYLNSTNSIFIQNDFDVGSVSDAHKLKKMVSELPNVQNSRIRVNGVITHLIDYEAL